MKVLVIGSGGREHALVWKISQSNLVEKIYCAPGNAGTALLAENVSINADDINALADFAERNAIDLTVVGPEAPLVKGIVDEFMKRKLKCFGPTQKAAVLEGSKIFTRELCKKYNIPSAEFDYFEDAEEAIEYVKEKGAPLVVKADGLAAGKGVIIAENELDAINAVNACLEEKVFGKAGERILIEEKLVGEEASFIVVCDGDTFISMVDSQDHKRVGEGDKGKNSGGMGAYSPAPIVTEEIREQIEEKIISRTINALKDEGIEFKGALYAGLMINRGEARLLEYNCRFGDPETQVILPRMKSDLVPVLKASVEGKLKEQSIEWSKQVCTSVVLASGGYPDVYEKGKEIFGLESVSKMKDVFVFHAGTALKENSVVTSGGRVLNVTALGNNIKDSIANAYSAVNKISFEKMYYRKDIGWRALKQLEEKKTAEKMKTFGRKKY